MTKRLICTLAVVFALVGATIPELQAQQLNTMRVTTLSAAMARGANTMKVTSATGFTASTGSQDYVVWVDREAMRITAVSGTTITVQRGYGQSLASAHSSGVYAIVGAAGSVSTGSVTGGPFVQSTPIGTCVQSGQGTLPLVNIRTGEWAQCVGDNSGNYTWTPVSPLMSTPPTTPTRACTPPGMQALGLITTDGDSTFPLQLGTNKTPVAGTLYYGTIYVPQTTLMTGISILNGLVAATDKVIVVLYDSAGNYVTSSDTAGTTASGAARFQDIAFTASYLAPGPGRYWIALQINGTTTRFSAVNLTPGATTAGLGAFIGILGSSFTGTFGTLPSTLQAGGSPASGALPTSLISAVAPIGCLY